MLRSRLLNSRHMVYLLVLMLALWGMLAWYVSTAIFSHEYQSLIEKDQLHARDISVDIANSFRRNLHFVAGVSDTFQRGIRIWDAVGEFAPSTRASRLPREVLTRRWLADQKLKDLNQQLEVIQNALGIDLIFVVNSAGDCIAASNSNTPWLACRNELR